MERAYNVYYTAHRRTSLVIDPIPGMIVYASNKESARELAAAIVRDYYEIGKGYTEKSAEYMTKQYKITIERA